MVSRETASQIHLLFDQLYYAHKHVLVLALPVSDRQIEKEFVHKKSISRETEVICEAQHCDLFAGLLRLN